MFLGLKWQYLAISSQKGPFWGVLGPPNDISVWSKRPKLTPPDVENNVQPCSPNVQPIPGRWDYLWPNMASFFGQKGPFWGVLGPPNDISVWSKRPKLTPPDVENNVQPCSPNVQPIWGRWDYLWPPLAIFGLFLAKKGHFGGF